MDCRRVLSVCGAAVSVSAALAVSPARAGVIGFSLTQIVDEAMLEKPWPVEFARGVSPDGAVVVGFGSASGTQCFRWTRAAQTLGLDGGDQYFDASSGGAVVVGTGSGAGVSRAIRWTSMGGIEGLAPSDPQTQFPESAQGVSDDGAFIVGLMGISDGPFRFGGFVWDSTSTVATPLGLLPGTNESDAHAISGDGDWIGGVSGSFVNGAPVVVPFQIADPGSVCTVWQNTAPYTAEALMIGGPRGVPPAELPGRVTKLNTDGSVAVGGTFAAPGVVAFVHHRPTATTIVPGHPDGFGQTEALGVSADGRRAVGAFEDNNALATGAWFWDARGGVFDLFELLEDRGALPPGFVGIAQATDISSNGVVISAFGVRDFAFRTEPLVITVPAPCDGDANGDFVVDFNDVTSILANWLNDYLPFPGTGPGDANLDGVVDFNDITSTLGAWLEVCGGE